MKPVMPSLFVVAVLTASCVNTSNLPPNIPVSVGTNETVVVLGVVPSYQVSFLAGSTNENHWRPEGAFLETRNFPEDGYVVVKIPSLSGTKSYGLAQVQPRGIAGQRFVPCQGNNILTFAAPPGKVVYIGDVDYDMDLLTGKTLSYKYSSTPQKASRFLVSNYPELASKMEIQEIKELTIETNECDAHVRPLFINGAMLFIPGQAQEHSSHPGTYRAWEPR